MNDANQATPPPRAGKQGAGATCCSKTRWAQLAGPARRCVQDSRLLTHQSFRRSQIGKGCPPRSSVGTLRGRTMSGRGGRGRGRGANLTFNIEAVGMGKGEALPPPTLQPSPLFPPLEYKPVPLQTGEEVEYMLALKQELRGAMKNSPYFLKPSAPKKDVERYSDKYQTSGPVESTTEWTPDWRQFPPELKTRVRKIKKQRATVTPKSKTPLPTDKEEAIKKLETLEKKEEEVTSEEEEEKEEGEEGKEEEEEEYDEEEFEEETDYIMSYFDNGEDFGGDSDDNMDEAIY